MKSLRRLILVALAAVMVGLVPATSASADPFGLDLNNGVMDLGNVSGVRAVDSTVNPPDPPVTLDGDVTNGDVVVPINGFVFPTKVAEVSPGLEATINMVANEDITGTFNSSTGSLDLDVNLKATVTVFGSDCVIDPIEATLSTSGLDPYVGVEFSGGLDQPGAIVGRWDSLPPVQGGGSCTLVGQLIAGPGGLWLSQDIRDPRTCDDVPAPAKCGSIAPPTVAPAITSSPPASTADTSASFAFTEGAGETQPVDRFECRLDGDLWEGCSDGTQTYADLTVGGHVFEVRAANAVGEGPVSSFNWEIAGVEPPPPPECPAGQTGVPPNCKRIGQVANIKVKLKNRKAKAGKKTKIGITVRAKKGDRKRLNATIRLKAKPNKFVKIRKKIRVKGVKPGKSKTVRVPVRFKRNAKKKKVTLIARGGKNRGKLKIRVK